MPTVPPTVALASLAIRDFRGIDHLDLDFRGPDGLPNHLVVLAGPNGCGKTSIIEAALIASGGHRLILGQRGKRAIRRGASNYHISGTFVSGGRSFESIDSAESPPREPVPAIPHWYFSSWRDPRFKGSVNVTVGRPGRPPAKNDKNRLHIVKQQLATAAAVEKFASGNRTFLKTYPQWIGAINEAWSEFDVSPGGRFDVELAENEEGAGTFDLFYLRPEQPRLEVDYLSAGQLEVFSFLSELVLNDDREGIIFIDEPELHLDPQWHRPIVRSLMRLQPRAQFIITTHSPEIFDAARSYERHFLVPEDDPRAHLWGDVRGIGAEA